LEHEQVVALVLINISGHDITTDYILFDEQVHNFL